MLQYCFNHLYSRISLQSHLQVFDFIWLWKMKHTLAGCPELVKVSILRGIRKLFGHKPGKLALRGPAWVGEVDLMTFRDHFPPQLFCDSPLKYTNSTVHSLFLSQRKCKFTNTESQLTRKDVNSSATSLLYLTGALACNKLSCSETVSVLLPLLLLLWSQVPSAGGRAQWSNAEHPVEFQHIHITILFSKINYAPLASRSPPVTALPCQLL